MELIENVLQFLVTLLGFCLAVIYYRPVSYTHLLFKVCLADNGTEFSNPRAIEYDRQGNLRTHIFYCDPSSPYQKGSAERNHEFIRLSLIHI